jgi:hypothetical protein
MGFLTAAATVTANVNELATRITVKTLISNFQGASFFIWVAREATIGSIELMVSSAK